LNDEHIKITVEAITYMKMNLSADITTEELASHVGYSHFHFIRIFKEVTGIAPRHYLSALRIEAGKSHLSESTSSVLKVLLSLGFQSIGTFSSRFKQYVGQSPREFRQKMGTLQNQLIQFGTMEQTQSLETLQFQSVRCKIIPPLDFKGILFAGLFPRPIPDQRPIVGTALLHKNSSCLFSNIPEGKYYMLIAGIPWNLNPKKYFSSDSLLRGKYEQPLEITSGTNIDITVKLREPMPYDPPILINLPLLLYEKNKAK
jgi:AraC-like DNA-binding protein